MKADWHLTMCFVAQVSHEKALQPGVGHPSASDQLQRLTAAEQERHVQCQEQMDLHTHSLQVLVTTISCLHLTHLPPPPPPPLLQSAVSSTGKRLAEELVTETKRMLALCDSIPTTNEVIPGSESSFISHTHSTLYSQQVRWCLRNCL